MVSTLLYSQLFQSTSHTFLATVKTKTLYRQPDFTGGLALTLECRSVCTDVLIQESLSSLASVAAFPSECSVARAVSTCTSSSSDCTMGRALPSPASCAAESLQVDGEEGGSVGKCEGCGTSKVMHVWGSGPTRKRKKKPVIWYAFRLPWATANGYKKMAYATVGGHLGSAVMLFTMQPVPGPWGCASGPAHPANLD